jgi:hypothetical protein
MAEDISAGHCSHTLSSLSSPDTDDADTDDADTDDADDDSL